MLSDYEDFFYLGLIVIIIIICLLLLLLLLKLISSSKIVTNFNSNITFGNNCETISYNGGARQALPKLGGKSPPKTSRRESKPAGDGARTGDDVTSIRNKKKSRDVYQREHQKSSQHNIKKGTPPPRTKRGGKNPKPVNISSQLKRKKDGSGSSSEDSDNDDDEIKTSKKPKPSGPASGSVRMTRSRKLSKRGRNNSEKEEPVKKDDDDTDEDYKDDYDDDGNDDDDGPLFPSPPVVQGDELNLEKEDDVPVGEPVDMEVDDIVPTVTSSITCCLKYIFRTGEHLPFTFDDCSQSQDAYKKFKEKDSYILETCFICKERRLQQQFNSNLFREDNKIICGRCFNGKDEHKIVNGNIVRFERFGAKNNTDPFHCSSTDYGTDAMIELTRLKTTYGPLSYIEVLFIAKRVTFMSVVYLKTGQKRFDGGVISYNLPEVDATNDIKELPRNCKDLHVCIVKKYNNLNEEDYKLFKVRTNAIYDWLNFLRKYNPNYKSITVTSRSNWLTQITGSPLHKDDVNITDHIPKYTTETKSEPIDITLMSQESAANNANIDEHGDAEDEDAKYPPGTLFRTLAVDEEEGIDISEEEKMLRSVQQVVKEKTKDLLYPTVPQPLDPDNPIDEYKDDAKLLELNNPTLFPFGNGDVTSFGSDLTYPVTFLEMAEHLMYYAEYDEKQKKYRYPFVEHGNVLFQAFDIWNRKRMIQQANIYMKQNYDHNIIQNGLSNPALLMHGLSRYCGNCAGSAPYFAIKKKELKTTVEQFGGPHYWFSVSLADFHIPLLWAILPQPSPEFVDDSGSVIPDKKTEFIRWKNQTLIDHIHIVNDFMTFRSKEFFSALFNDKCLEVTWFWYRFEWQKRGTNGIHIHGMFQLKHAPDLSNLTDLVYFGRKSQLLKNAIVEYFSLENTDPTTTSNYCKDDVFLEDIWVKLGPVVNKYNEQEDDAAKKAYLQSQLQILDNDIDRGIRANDQFCAFTDFTVTCNSDSEPLPSDAKEENRSPKVHPDIHPCSKDFPTFNKQHATRVVNQIHRHYHSADYCMKNKSKPDEPKCRFQIPKDIQDCTRLRFKEVLYKKNSPLHGHGRIVKKSVDYKTNDRHMTPHSKLLTSMWNGMVDIRVVVSLHEVLAYISKYANKMENSTEGFEKIIVTSLESARDNDRSGSTAVRCCAVQSFTKAHKELPEILFILSGNLLVVSSTKVVNIRLQGMTNKVLNINVTDDDDDDVSSSDDKMLVDGDSKLRRKSRANVLVVATAFDAYGIRDDITRWGLFSSRSEQEIERFEVFWKTSLSKMSLQEFCSKYRVMQGGRNVNKIMPHNCNQLCIVDFSPNYPSSKNHKDYCYYCYYSLVKFHYWSLHPNTIILNYLTQQFDKIDMDTISNFPALHHLFQQDKLRTIFYDDNDYPKEDKLQNWLSTRDGSSIVKTIWECFKQSLRGSRTGNVISAEEEVDDLGADLNEVLSQNYGDYPETTSQDIDLNEHSQNNMMGYLLQRNPLLNLVRDPDNIPWSDTHDWRTLYNTTRENDFSDEGIQKIEATYKSIEDSAQTNCNQRKTVVYEDLNDDQKEVFNIIKYILFEQADCINETEHNKLQIVRGKPGVGKSFLIDCLHHFLSEQEIGIIQMAPTGAAAIVCSGVTLHSSSGLNIGASDLKGPMLDKLQKLYSNVKVLCIDEMSMLNSDNLCKVHKFSQKIKMNKMIFGGQIVILVGDIHQLPCVKGTELWKDTSHRKGSKKTEVNGHVLYKMFTNVVTLDKSVRVNPDQVFLTKVLNDVANGSMDKETYNLFKEQVLVSKKDNKSEFLNTSKVLGIGYTNEEVNKYNLEATQDYQQPPEVFQYPILKIKSQKVGTGNPPIDCKIQETLYIKVGAPAINLYNFATHFGIGNGSRCTIKDIVFLKDVPKRVEQDGRIQHILPLPDYIVAEFPTYCGPAFFDNILDTSGNILVDRSKFVPIRQHDSTQDFSETKTKNGFNGFGVKLGYAITGHKSQGVTISGLVLLITSKLPALPGWLYVVLSRVSSIQQLGTHNLFSYESVTDGIKRLTKFKEVQKETERLNKLHDATVQKFRNRNATVDTVEQQHRANQSKKRKATTTTSTIPLTGTTTVQANEVWCICQNDSTDNHYIECSSSKSCLSRTWFHTSCVSNLPNWQPIPNSVRSRWFCITCTSHQLPEHESNLCFVHAFIGPLIQLYKHYYCISSDDDENSDKRQQVDPLIRSIHPNLLPLLQHVTHSTTSALDSHKFNVYLLNNILYQGETKLNSRSTNTDGSRRLDTFYTNTFTVKQNQAAAVKRGEVGTCYDLVMFFLDHKRICSNPPDESNSISFTRFNNGYFTYSSKAYLWPIIKLEKPKQNLSTVITVTGSSIEVDMSKLVLSTIVDTATSFKIHHLPTILVIHALDLIQMEFLSVQGKFHTTVNNLSNTTVNNIIQLPLEVDGIETIVEYFAYGATYFASQHYNSNYRVPSNNFATMHYDDLKNKGIAYTLDNSCELKFYNSKDKRSLAQVMYVKISSLPETTQREIRNFI